MGRIISPFQGFVWLIGYSFYNHNIPSGLIFNNNRKKLQRSRIIVKQKSGVQIIKTPKE